MQNRYQGVKIGLSDHSGQIFPSLAAVTLGAQLVEVHVTFDKSIFGPDSTSSLTFAELSQLSDGIEFVSKMRANPVNKNDVSTYESMRNIFQKSLAVNKSMSAGDIIRFSDLESKKPANMGISATKFEGVLGKRINRDMAKYEFLNLDDLST
jgi:N,N'-diacetyllegionaminate synthase